MYLPTSDELKFHIRHSLWRPPDRHFISPWSMFFVVYLPLWADIQMDPFFRCCCCCCCCWIMVAESRLWSSSDPGADADDTLRITPDWRLLLTEGRLSPAFESWLLFRLLLNWYLWEENTEKFRLVCCELFDQISHMRSNNAICQKSKFLGN